MVDVIKSWSVAGLDVDHLEKALKAPHSVNYGTWNGLKIVAIGPKGGKIVGYNAKHEPIYAGSAQAAKLVQHHAAMQTLTSTSAKANHPAVKEWLTHLGIKALPDPQSPGYILVSDADGAKLNAAFNLHLGSTGHVQKIHLATLVPHVGQALKPSEHEELDYGATMAAGDAEHPAFPKQLSTLKEIPAGEFAGSHGNKLFQDPATGKKYIFKTKNPTIARAEEAASRLGRLILGPGKVQDAKYAQLGHTDGVLIAVADAQGDMSVAPSLASLKEHAGDIVAHNIFDWIISNHDAHGENFLKTPKGLVAVDKGQAWKWVGEDELGPQFNPNEHKQLASQFWGAVKNGKIQKDVLPVVNQIFGNVAKISDEQFKAIVAPYVAARAGKDGVPASQVEEKMLTRLHEAKSNWEWFLGSMLAGSGDKIAIHPTIAPGDAEPKLAAPAEKLATEAPATPPPVQKLTGFPVKKGAVTLHHPGGPPLAGWPKGYPGPGYNATIDYKGQQVHVGFFSANGQMVVQVSYPDGKIAVFDSPNKASDSVYLWSKGLPLDMSGAEKKAKGISYSATKMLNLKAFEQEFKESGHAPSVGSMSPAQLEAAKIVPEAAPELTAYAAIKAHGSGLIQHHDLLPIEVQEWAAANKKDIFAQVTPTSDGGHDVVLWSSKHSADGKPTYYGWPVMKDGQIGVAVTHEAPEALKGTTFILEPKPPAPAGAPPKAVVDKKVKAKVEIPASPAVDGPLPGGTKITVKKKGIKDPVTLEVLPNGQFKVTVNGEANTFQSLSSASDHVWVIGQGFKNAAHYLTATGKKKIPSGGGWKFWGVKPGQEPKAPAPKATPSEDNFETMPVSKGTWQFLEGLYIGSTVSWNGEHGSAVDATKTGWDSWSLLDTATGKSTPDWSDVDIANFLTTGSKKSKDGEFVVAKPGGAPEPPKAPAPEAAAPVPPAPAQPVPSSPPAVPAQPSLQGQAFTKKEFGNLNFWLNLPVGTKVQWTNEAGVWTGEHVEGFDKPWRFTDPNGAEAYVPFGSMQQFAEDGTKESGFSSLGGDGKIYVQKPIDDAIEDVAIDDPSLIPSEPHSTEWKTLPAKPKQSWFLTAPFGTEVKITSVFDGEVVTLDLKKTKAGSAGLAWELIGASGNPDLLPDQKHFGSVTLETFAEQAKEFLVKDLPEFIAGNTPFKEVHPSALPVGTKLSWSSSAADGAQAIWHAQKVAPLSWTAKLTIGDSVTELPNSTDATVLGALTTATSGNGTVLVEAPKNPPKKTVHATISQLLPQQAGAVIKSKIEDLTDAWAKTKTSDGKYLIGEKPTGWPNWAPPPGAWIEGSYDGKKLWFTTAISGYSEDGDTSAMVNFVVVNQDGKLFHKDQPAPAEKAEARLLSLVQEATPASQVETVFPGFSKNVFLAGVTKEGVNYNATHGSDFGAETPDAAEVLDGGHPSDLTGAAAAQPVKTGGISLLDAFPHLEEKKLWGDKLGLKPHGNDPGTYVLTLQNSALLPEAQKNVLNNIAQKYGIPTMGLAQSNYMGSFLTITTANVMDTKVHGVVMAAKDVPPIDVAVPTAEPLQATEVIDQKALIKELKQHPKKIFKTWKPQKKLGALNALPIGAVLTLGNGLSFTKVSNDPSVAKHWENEDHETIYASTLANKIAYYEGAVVSAGKGVVVPKSKEAKAPTPPPAPWVPPPKDPKAEEKKTWAAEHKSLSPEQTKHLAWWLQKAGLSGTEIYARQTKSGNLLIGDGTTAFAKHLPQGVPVATPHGELYAISWSELKHLTPEATTTKGPDGAEYPYGTTFETQAIPKTFEEMVQLEQGFTKFSPYSGHEPTKYQKTIKIAGTTAAHKLMAESIVKKYALDSPILTGGHYTMFFASDTTMAKVVHHETQVTPKIPKQPDAPKLKSVGVSLGVPNEGQPAPVNRDDLSDVDSIIPFRQGYSIRFGTGGVLMDGQLRMHRIKLPNGQIVNRFVGELTKSAPKLDPKKQFHYYSAQSTTPDPMLSGWKQHDYDPATGIITMSDDENWTQGPSYTSGAELTDGAMVYAFHNKTQQRTFVVDVPVGVDAEQALHQAVGKLGVFPSDAMAQPDELDERIMKKIQILKSYLGAKGFQHIETLNLLSKPRAEREATLDAQLKGKIGKEWIDGARVVIGHDGYHHVELDDLDDKLGLSQQMHAVGTHISIEGIARAISSGGYGGQAQCLLNGNSRNIDSGAGATASGESDMKGGGSVGRFFAAVSKSVNHHTAVGAGKPYMVCHPRILKKTNWYAANGDTYGHQPGGEHFSTSAWRTRPGALGITGSGHEFMIENVSARDIVGAVVGSVSEKNELVGYFQKMGLSEINGCPLDQFVVVGSVATGLTQTIQKLPLLKE